MIIYLGTSTSMFAAILLPVLILIPMIFGFSILWSSVDVAAMIVFLFMIFSSIIMIIYLLKYLKKIYVFGKFLTDRVEIFLGFNKKILFYKDIKDSGIGCYQHQGLASSGILVRCFYFSINKLNSYQKNHINLLENNEFLIKVPINKKNTNFLQKLKLLSSELSNSCNNLYIDK